ncbi:MAG: alpha/beta hydrolase [Alphaproteobacteria bacterium]
MQTPISFTSDGLRLAGILHRPDDAGGDARRPAFLVLHGFGTNKDGGTSVAVAHLLEEWGYVALRFDMRGCGDSEGEFGRVICLEQVEDTKNALTWLATQPGVDPDRIGVVGHSFGAAVAVYAGGTDTRIAAVISSCGWGHGERKFRGQHPTPEAWKRFTDILAEGPRHRARTGRSLMVSRWDIVPIPEHLRGNLAAGAVMEFPAETAQSMMDFTAENVVGAIAPRPLLLLHAANDSVTPTEQSLGLFAHARQPCDLMLFSDVDHFPFSTASTRARSAVRDWLGTYLPVRPAG